MAGHGEDQRGRVKGGQPEERPADPEPQREERHDREGEQDRDDDGPEAPGEKQPAEQEMDRGEGETGRHDDEKEAEDGGVSPRPAGSVDQAEVGGDDEEGRGEEHHEDEQPHAAKKAPAGREQRRALLHRDRPLVLAPVVPHRWGPRGPRRAQYGSGMKVWSSIGGRT